uniref:Uncharacterized protein n=1 Tax=Thermosporothrix sp. COM3 TaxID=2490863 RepID=A0A455SJ92_9CHLR|nr:hypothetical protein KTC_21790 [Thermosporothrix sp. COM3]
MSGTTIDPLPIPGAFSACPTSTETERSLRFSRTGTVEMVMRGQGFNGRARGRFSIQTLTRTSALIYLFNVKIYDLADTTYSNPMRTLPSRNVTVSREGGAFAFEKPGQPETEDQSCLLYRARYRFDVDPLSLLGDNAEATSGPCYYQLDTQEELPRNVLADMGITVEK